MSLDLSSAANQTACRKEAGRSRRAVRLLHAQTEIVPAALTVASGRDEGLSFHFFFFNSFNSSMRRGSYGGTSAVALLSQQVYKSKFGTCFETKRTKVLFLNSVKQSADYQNAKSLLLSSCSLFFVFVCLRPKQVSFHSWRESRQDKEKKNTNTRVYKQQETQAHVQRLLGQMKSCRC